MSPRVHPSQHSPRPSYARPSSQQVARHDSGAAASAYSRPGTRQSAYHAYDARDSSPQPAASTAGYRPSSSSGMELQLSSRVRGGAGDHDGYDEYDGIIPGAPVDEGYGSQRSYPYGSSPDMRSISRGSNYGGAGGSARGRERSSSMVRAGSSSDGRPILHYARALYPYTPAIPEEIGFARNDVLAILMHQDDGWWFAELPDKPGYQGLVPSNYLAPLN
ncbi:hypothetical protein KEM54_001744 [Ascosphaera aggregata]|nr:hypothetical protein KEM54_001744 [Ascosphaera aggregata]